MPMLDMPLHELKQYQGTNPCPADIDAFWDASVREMEDLGTACELVPADFQVPGAECFHMYFTGMGGARIHCKYVRPEGAQNVAAVCYFHGYSGAAPDFFQLLPFVAAGMAVAALDCRGQAGWSEDKGGTEGSTFHGHIIRGLAAKDPAKLLFRQIYLDTAQMARIVMALPEVDGSRVGAMGGSQGGGLTLACAALTPKLNRAAPTYPFLCDYKRVWDMDLDKDAYVELKEHFRQYDPLHKREDEIWTMLGYIDNQHLAHRIRAKVRMYTGLMDSICPPSTQFAAYNKMVCEKESVIYPDFGHEYLPGMENDALQFLLGM